MAERIRTNGDGSRTLEVHIGKADLSDSDNPKAWKEELTVGKDEVFARMVRLAADVEVAALPAGKNGVLVKLASSTYGLPLDQAEALNAGLTEAIAAKKREG